MNSGAVNDKIQLKPELKFHHNSKTQLNGPLLFRLLFLPESVRDKANFSFLIKNMISVPKLIQHDIF